MKLRSKKNKNKNIAIVVAAAMVVLIAVLVIVGINVIKSANPDSFKGKNDILEIVVSSYPDSEYFIGENFDPTGLKIQVMTGDTDNPYFVEYPNADLTITGFNSSVANEKLTITVTYKGVSTSFNVKIMEYPTTVTLESIRLSDNFYSSPYTISEWNTYGPIFDGVKLILTYSDGTEKEVPMKSRYCSDVEKKVSSAGTTQFYVTYPDELMADGRPARCTVTVTITN